MNTVNFSGFQPQVADKVIRLLLLLDRIVAHPLLRTRVCLHGGTALNLFVLNVPRLSVDIDLNYIGSTDRDVMLAERPEVENAVMNIARELGFNPVPGTPEHSGRTFRLLFQSSSGSDSVKIDLDYLNRSPLLPPQPKTIALDTGAHVTFPITSTIELFAGKTKALLERVAIRDLYDVVKITEHYPHIANENQEQLLHRIMLYYLSISAPFPRPLDVASRFVHRERDVKDALYPMLLSNDRPNLPHMIDVAQSFVEQVSRPLDEEESTYLARAAKGDFAPDLLFSRYPETLAAAQADPAAIWKMTNLAKV